ncbi:hypothetical protein A2U01_0064789, partial [Trifolium medium]|nr:hypothetical protein [Trifolium medium]
FLRSHRRVSVHATISVSSSPPCRCAFSVLVVLCSDADKTVFATVFQFTKFLVRDLFVISQLIMASGTLSQQRNNRSKGKSNGRGRGRSQPQQHQWPHSPYRQTQSLYQQPMW